MSLQHDKKQMPAIEFIHEFKLTKKDLAELDDEVVAVIAVLCFAVSEINSLMRLYIFSAHEFIEDGVIDTANSITRNVLLRAWSAKLFEAVSFIEETAKGKKVNSPEIVELAKNAEADFQILKRSETFSLVRSIRHESTNHYNLKPAKKNLEHVAAHADVSLYLHDKNGNSFYPLGEEVMFIGRINRFALSGASMEEKSKKYESWMEWNHKATIWLGDAHHKFVTEIFLKHFPERKAEKRMHWLPKEMVGEAEHMKTPLFLRTKDRE